MDSAMLAAKGLGEQFSNGDMPKRLAIEHQGNQIRFTIINPRPVSRVWVGAAWRGLYFHDSLGEIDDPIDRNRCTSKRFAFYDAVVV